MEDYRSYPDDRARYQEGLPPEPDYPENPGWYRESERYGDPRPDAGPPDPAGARAAASSPGPRPSPTPAPGHVPGSAPVPGQAPVPWSGDGPPPAPRRPLAAPGSPSPAGDGVYRSKRPATAILVGVAAGLLELPALGLLWDAAFADPASPSGVVAAACLVLALPLLAIGLYAIATGAVRAAGPNSGQAWLRPPVAYLSVALVLFIAAGLAA